MSKNVISTSFVEASRNLRLSLDQIRRRGSVNRAMATAVNRQTARYNRGIRAKDPRSLCTLLAAVLFNLPLIIVFCSRVYEDRPMIRITRGADCSAQLLVPSRP